MKGLRRSLSAAALAFAAGCGPQTYVVQQYPGAVRPPETIAILRINADDPVRVLAIDGEYADPKLAPDTRLHIEMLPGKHELELRAEPVVASEEIPRISRTVRFEARAGEVYRAAFEVLHPELRLPVVYAVNRDSDKPVLDVTIPTKREGEGARPLPSYLAPPPIIAPEPAPADASPPAEPPPAVPSTESPAPAAPDPSVPPLP